MKIRVLGTLTVLACALPIMAQEGAPAGGRGRGPAAPPTWVAPPRIPDQPQFGKNAGKPDLGGKGMWGVPYVTDMAKTTGGVEWAQDVPFTPKSAEIFKHRVDTLSKEDPEGYCLPPGVPRMMYTPYPAEILQMQDRIVFIYEGGAHVWRNIWLDGRKHTDDPNPTYLGESVGHWEGDTLVVDVIGFNERTWLDFAGHPHGEKLHVTERYTIAPDGKSLTAVVTVDDPDTFNEPLHMMNKWRKVVNPMLETVCAENNNDSIFFHQKLYPMPEAKTPDF